MLLQEFFRSFVCLLVPCFLKVFYVQIEESDVAFVFERILPSALTSVTTKEYALSALVKLDTRFSLTNELVQIFLPFFLFYFIFICVYFIYLFNFCLCQKLLSVRKDFVKCICPSWKMWNFLLFVAWVHFIFKAWCNVFSRIRNLIAANQTHHNLELQQRSAEFARVLDQGELKLVFQTVIRRHISLNWCLKAVAVSYLFNPILKWLGFCGFLKLCLSFFLFRLFSIFFLLSRLLATV